MDYSKSLPFALNEEGRLEKARQILSIIRDFYSNKELNKMKLLDYGSSTGIITNYMSKYFSKVVGVDVDDNAVKQAKKRYGSRNLFFRKIDSEITDLSENSFDVIIANQVYNCVDDQKKMFNEIYKLLKPGGICFLGARNKLVFIESQYKLPLLNFLPLQISRAMIKISGKGNDFLGRKYLYYNELTKLVSKFKVHDYTVKVLKNPNKFKFYKYRKYSGLANVLPLKLFMYFMPNYLWLLEKSDKK